MTTTNRYSIPFDKDIDATIRKLAHQYIDDDIDDYIDDDEIYRRNFFISYIKGTTYDEDTQTLSSNYKPVRTHNLLILYPYEINLKTFNAGFIEGEYEELFKDRLKGLGHKVSDPNLKTSDEDNNDDSDDDGYDDVFSR